MDNKYDPKTGMLEGSHLEHLAKIGICRLVERVNNSIAGCERRLTVDDLPGKVRSMVEESDKLSEQLRKCESVHVTIAGDYLKAQAKLAANALPLVQAELERRRQVARDALAQLRANLTGKGNPLVGAAADMLMRAVNIHGAVEIEAGISAWSFAYGICRDTAANKTVPRWLTVLLQQLEIAKMGASV